jgi:hypothetical protein
MLVIVLEKNRLKKVDHEHEHDYELGEETIL